MKEMSKIFSHMTVEEEKEWWAKEQEAYRLDQERFAHEVAARKAVDHHINCRDCGHYVPKLDWVLRSSRDAIERGLRPLCLKCRSEYDSDYY